MVIFVVGERTLESCRLQRVNWLKNREQLCPPKEIEIAGKVYGEDTFLLER